MSPFLALSILAAYFGLLYLISYFSSRKADARVFYTAGRNTSWWLVSYGMIGVAISGITFISVPGEVSNSQFSYFQLVLGISLGLLIVAYVLLPVYYKQRVISIYGYLEERFGYWTHKTGASFFLLAHLLGASFRLYLMAFVLQLIVFDPLGLPFWATVLLTILLIWFYTYKGGIQTVIFTDTLQTTFLLLAVVASLYSLAQGLNISFAELPRKVWEEGPSQVLYSSWSSPNNFWKLLLTGTVLTIMTNGLDQAIMQKHLTCPSLRDAQKNITLLSLVLIVVNLLFLFLGGALWLYAQQEQLALPEQSDQLYPWLATEQLGTFAGITFVIGIAAAAYSSADSSLTGLTTAFCVDFLGYQTHRADDARVRTWVHLGFSLLLFVLILLFRAINDQSVIRSFIKVSGYVYGPLLGLFAFGLVHQASVRDRWIPGLCLLTPLLGLILDLYAEDWLGYPLGYEIIVLNALLTFIGLFFLIVPPTPNPTSS